MNFFVFNNSILMSDGTAVQRHQDATSIEFGLGVSRICMVDCDVLIASAKEEPVELKDSILVRKFHALYQQEPYVIQDERIDTNLFQVMGIKEQKIRHVYSLIPADMVEVFVPYGMALRHTLIKNDIDLNKSVVFVDDCEGECLLTVFDGMKFSRTRVMVSSGQNILPEIKRSHIEFNQKIREFAGSDVKDFIIVVNSQRLIDEISINKENLSVRLLDIPYPSIEGLKDLDTLVKYALPEENIRKERQAHLRKKAISLGLSACLVVAGFLFFIFNKMALEQADHRYALAEEAREELQSRLERLDREIYRTDLRTRPVMNYGVVYLSMLEIIPSCYSVDYFKFHKGHRWDIEMLLFADAQKDFEQIPRIKILRKAQIQDVFVNDQPGKHLKIIL